jgi:hypothetical protein
VTWSLGEVEAMARKAARGAGYAWGVADEAGHAVRWLEARQAGGITDLADLLVEVSNETPADFTPKSVADWTCNTNHLCPVMTGLVFADTAELREAEVTRLNSVMAPKLMLPFLGHVAAIQGQPLSVVAGAGRAIVRDGDLDMSGDWTAAMETRVDPDPSAWKILTRMASRTYAPATEASRLKGAGAGLTDND